MSANSAVIVVDNLRVGGVQRLALDESYFLVSLGYQVSIVSLESERLDDDLKIVDGDYFKTHLDNIKLIYLSSNNLESVRVLGSILFSNPPKILISHSAKGIMLCQILRLGFFHTQKYKVIGYVHQLISLSRSVQKWKRLAFFQFANSLFASSKQFELEITSLKRKNIVYKYFFPKSITFDRMGIHLDRIKNLQTGAKKIHGSKEPTFIFLSRVVGWKGFETFYNICTEVGASSHKIVFSSPLYLPSKQIENFKRLKNHHILIHKGIADVFPGEKFVHIYPTTYGKKVKYPQNIGLNVLECLAVGVPSLISEEDFLSWPELKDSPLVVTTDWSIKDVQDKIEAFCMLSKSIKREEQTRVLPIISIESHIKRILEISER